MKYNPANIIIDNSENSEYLNGHSITIWPQKNPFIKTYTRVLKIPIPFEPTKIFGIRLKIKKRK